MKLIDFDAEYDLYVTDSGESAGGWLNDDGTWTHWVKHEPPSCKKWVDGKWVDVMMKGASPELAKGK